MSPSADPVTRHTSKKLSSGGIADAVVSHRSASVNSPVIPVADAVKAQDQSAASNYPGNGTNGEIFIGDVEPSTTDNRVVLYVIKADETSYINYIKPLILAEELNIPHVLSVIDTKTQWARTIHPERMVPALCDRDPQTDELVRVFEGTACLQYLADRFDIEGLWSGRTAKERGEVFTWTAYQTAGIGATAKYWLYFLRGYPTRANPIQLPQTIAKLHANTVVQWDVLEKRLGLPGQQYIALPDRPTVADLSYFPFAMPWMFKFLDVDMTKYPHIQEWASKMGERQAIKKVMAYAPGIGH